MGGQNRLSGSSSRGRGRLRNERHSVETSSLLADPKVTTIVVEHRDRLAYMNTELVEAVLSAHGRRLVVLDDSEMDDDLVRDMIDVLTSFCARLYGRRSARNRAEKALRCAAENLELTTKAASSKITGSMQKTRTA